MNSLRRFLQALLIIIVLLPFSALNAQEIGEAPEVVTLKSQYDEVQRRTRIYEGFRAIREDMFQEIRKQSLDSLSKALQNVKSFEEQVKKLNEENAQLQAQVLEANAIRDKAIAERESINFLGKPIGKTFYNFLLWTIIASLAIISLVLVVLFRGARQISRKRHDDFHELLEEYETYRKTSRERLEKITIDHFNEIKKLKGL